MLQNRGFGEGKIVSFLHTENRGLGFISRKGQGSKELEDIVIRGDVSAESFWQSISILKAMD